MFIRHHLHEIDITAKTRAGVGIFQYGPAFIVVAAGFLIDRQLGRPFFGNAVIIGCATFGMVRVWRARKTELNDWRYWAALWLLTVTALASVTYVSIELVCNVAALGSWTARLL